MLPVSIAATRAWVHDVRTLSTPERSACEAMGRSMAGQHNAPKITIKASVMRTSTSVNARGWFRAVMGWGWVTAR
jgi:hypothetical protein